MLLHQFLLELFDPSPNYSLPVALQKLRAIGGIACLLNSLCVNHRQIAHTFSAPTGQTSPCVSLPRQQIRRVSVREFLLQSFLLYLLTLSFFIKLLLYYHGIRLQLDLHTQVIGFIFLVFIILSRKHRTGGHPKMKEESRNQQRIFRVRREEEELRLTVGQLKQGDIMLLKREENVEVDGIILQVTESELGKQGWIAVNEEDTNTGRTMCYKCSVWNDCQQNMDPFLLAGSQVTSGEVWMLVCLTAKWTSANRGGGQAELGGVGELSRVGRQVSMVMRAVVGVLVGVLGVGWIVGKGEGWSVLLSLLYTGSCLLLYLSYINHNEMLGFIAKYFQQQLHSKAYRILNPRLLQKLSSVDLIVMEDDTLTLARGRHLIHPAHLTALNRFADLKIILPPTASSSDISFYCRFGDDANQQLIFSSGQHSSLRGRLNMLANCKFIRVEYSDFRNYYLRMLQEMHYKMLYVSCSRSAMEDKKDEVQGGFQLITVKCGESSDKEGRIRGEWIRVTSGQAVQQVLVELIGRSLTYNRLKLCYYAVLLNSSLELLMLAGWALAGCTIDLNLNLLILYANRNRPYELYYTLTHSSSNTRKPHSSFSPSQFPFYLEFNLVLCIYYIYMTHQIYVSSNRQFQLFLLLMGNRQFRIEGLTSLRPFKWPHLRTLLMKSGIMLLLIFGEWLYCFWLGVRNDILSESLDILLLPIILILYSLFF